MSGREVWAPALEWFRTVMAEQLGKPENEKKSDWRGEPVSYLLRRMRDELEEVEGAIEGNAPAAEVARECADVANFAMMLAYKVARVSR